MASIQKWLCATCQKVFDTEEEADACGAAQLAKQAGITVDECQWDTTCNFPAAVILGFPDDDTQAYYILNKEL